MIVATYGKHRFCTGCGQKFHMSENNSHLDCGDGKFKPEVEAKVEAKAETKKEPVKKSVKSKKSK